MLGIVLVALVAWLAAVLVLWALLAAHGRRELNG